MALEFKKMKEKEILAEVQARYARQQIKHSARNAKYRFYRALFDNDESVWWGGGGVMPSKPIVNRYSLTFNFIAPLVEKWASFIVADQINWSVNAKRPDSEGHKAAQKAENILYKLHKRSLADRTLNEIALDAALLGTGWAKTLYDKDKKQTKYVYAMPEFVYPEPYLSVFSGAFRYVIYAYEMGVDDARAEYNDNSISPFILPGSEAPKDKEQAEQTCAIIECWDKDNFALIVGDKVKEGDANKYGIESPFVNFPLLARPGKIFGRTFVDWVVEANAYYNQLASQIADATRLNCNPPVKYKNAPLDYADQIKAGATGGVIPLTRDGDAEYLQWSGEPASVELLLNRVQNFIHDVSHMPKIAFGDIGQPMNSSRAMSIQYDAVIKVIRQARDNFTIGFQTLNSNLLHLAEKWEKGAEITTAVMGTRKRGTLLRRQGEEVPEIVVLKGEDVDGHYETEVIWPGVLPKDDVGAARLELEKRKENVQSTRTTMENLGTTDPDDEMDLMLSELSDERLHPKENAATLGAMAKGLQAISSAAPQEPGPPTQPEPPAGGGLGPERGIMPGAQGPEPTPPSPEEMANSEAQLSQGG